MGEAPLVRAQSPAAAQVADRPPCRPRRVLHPPSGRGRGARGARRGPPRIGEGSLLEPGCWLTLAPEARIEIGAGCFLNRNTMLAAVEQDRGRRPHDVRQRLLRRRRRPPLRRPDIPVPWQGFTSKGPVRIGSNCWFGVNCVVTSGVTIGDRCVIGANSVVTEDLPRGLIAAGAPARVVKEITGDRKGRTGAGEAHVLAAAWGARDKKVAGKDPDAPLSSEDWAAAYRWTGTRPTQPSTGSGRCCRRVPAAAGAAPLRRASGASSSGRSATGPRARTRRSARPAWRPRPPAG